MRNFRAVGTARRAWRRETKEYDVRYDIISMTQARFALAGEWPDSANLFFAHLHAPRFIAEADDRVGFPRFFITLLPEERRPVDATFCDLVRDGASFFYQQITEKKLKAKVRIEFIEGKHPRTPPRFLLALTPQGQTLIIEPHHPRGITRIDWSTGDFHLSAATVKQTTHARLTDMRDYHQEYLRKWQALRRDKRDKPYRY